MAMPTRLVTASDRLPDYAQVTTDVEVWNQDKWMEVCSISRRTDFPGRAAFKAKSGGTAERDILVLEIAIGLDRLVYNWGLVHERAWKATGDQLCEHRIALFAEGGDGGLVVVAAAQDAQFGGLQGAGVVGGQVRGAGGDAFGGLHRQGCTRGDPCGQGQGRLAQGVRRGGRR